MTRIPAITALALSLGAFASSTGLADAGATIGAKAPDFSLPDLEGHPVKLSDYAGKTVVLEWFNPGCPFVQYAHGEGPLKDMAGKATAQGAVWLSINSGAPGKQGAGVEANKAAVAGWKMSNPVLLDESGAVGKLYGARTTPQLYIVDPSGNLAYNGALDNAPRGAVDGGGPVVNLFWDGLTDVLGGKPARQASNKPYGCGVKYGS